MERNDLTTLCAHSDWGVTQCPIPGITILVEFSSVMAAYSAHCGDVLASKLPEMTSVGMLLIVTSRIEGSALGTFQMAQSSVSKGNCGAWDRTESG